MKERTRFEDEHRQLGLAEMEREVIEPDTRQTVKDSFSVPFRFICHLEIAFENTRTKMGATGTLIGRKYILTASHNLHTVDNLTARRIIVSPARNGEANSIGEVDADKYFVHPLWRRINWGYDYGLIKLKKEVALDTSIETDYKPLGCWGDPKYGGGTRLTPLAADKLDGRTAFVAGYPLTKNTSNNYIMSGGSGFLMGIAANRPIHPNDVFIYHTIDTGKGESGAPVWVRDDSTNTRYLVGIHSRGGREENGKYVSNLAVRITQPVLDQISAWMKL